MRKGWIYKKFDECIQKVPKYGQIKTSEYNESGLYPVISQESYIISGYNNSEEKVVHFDKPVIIFGDHTRVLKYIDFDFIIGADGVKILLTEDFLIPKMFKYYLEWYNVPSLGYSRHYKLLKEICDIPVPPLSVQQSIVAELDKINELISLKKAQLSDLDNLAQSIFYDMFGDPVENEKGWEFRTIGDICILKSGNSGANNSQPGELPYIKVGDMNLKGNETYITTSSNYICKENNIKDIFPIGTTIFPKRGGAILTNKKRLTKCEICCDLNVMGVIPNQDIVHPLIIYFYFLNLDFHKFANTGSTIPQINNYDISPLKICIPPLPLQQAFAKRIELIEQQKAQINSAIKDLETLLASRMQYWFE